MGTDINRALGQEGAGVYEMVEENGKRWVFYQLVQSQKAAVVAWAKRKVWKELADLKAAMAEDQYASILSSRADDMKAKHYEWGPFNIGRKLWEEICTDDGTLLVMHHALAHKQPLVTPEDIQRLFETQPDEFANALREVLRDPNSQTPGKTTTSGSSSLTSSVNP